MKNKKLKNYLSTLLASIVMIIIIIIIGAHILTTERVKELQRYQQFVSILQSNSTAYDNCSKKFFKQEYEIWKENKGYSDIIIGVDGNLEQIYNDPVEWYDDICADNFTYGIFICSNDIYSYICIINNYTETDATVTLIRSEFESGGLYWISTRSAKQISTNEFLLYHEDPIEQYQASITFTDYGTILINSESEEISEFNGEYLPIHSF